MRFFDSGFDSSVKRLESFHKLLEIPINRFSESIRSSAEKN